MLTVENWSAPMSQGDALHEVYATVTLNLQLNQVYFFIDVIPSPDACFFFADAVCSRQRQSGGTNEFPVASSYFLSCLIHAVLPRVTTH